ncbi:hypothetical protein TNCV_4003141 [Trichonephila clavipes]|nr:hypothetical protein TNCV_4003141 [Trichonephila clavipes]
MQNNSYGIDNENKRTNVKQYDFPTSNKNMCSDNKFHKKGQFNDATANNSNERIRCYNCGLFNHTSNEYKLHKLEESNLEKVDKLVKLEENYEILQRTFKITEKRLVEKEVQCKSLTEKILIVNALTESNDHPKTSMSTKELEINPSKSKTKKLKSSGRNANKTSDIVMRIKPLPKRKMICLDRLIFLTPSFWIRS